jgi:hypothetical protein
MKRMYTAAFLAAAVLLAACGGTAQAAPVSVYNQPAGAAAPAVFSLDDVREITVYNSDLLRVTRVTGAVTFINANLYNTLKTRLVNAQQGWVELYGAQTLINPAKAIVIACDAQGLNVQWSMTGPQYFADPTCGVFGQLKARAQNGN